MKTLTAVISIITATTLTGCAHNGYQYNDGGYGYGSRYGSGYSVERYYGSPSYNYYYVPQRSFSNHGHDHDRHDEWRHQHQHSPRKDHHDVESQTRPWGGGGQVDHHDGKRDFVRPEHHEGQNRQSNWGDASADGGRRGRRSDSNTRRDDDGHSGRRRD